MPSLRSNTGLDLIDDYANAVLSGQELVDDVTRRCVEYHLKRLSEPGVTIDVDRAHKAVEFMEAYFPFCLMPWERYLTGLVHAYKDGDVLFRSYLIVMGTGNGKNGFISALSLYLTSPVHGVPGYNVDIIANSELQAKTSFNDAGEAIDRHAVLQQHYKRTDTNIEHRLTKSYLRFNTSNAKTKAGRRSACLIFDEVFMYQDRAVINEFQASFGKRKDSRIFMITSQGNVREGVLDDELKKASDVISGANDELRMCPLIYRVSSAEEVLREDCWVKANPSYNYLPSLRLAIKTDFAELKYSSETEEAFYTKRMNWPKQNREMAVATHDELMRASGPIEIDLTGKDCIAGLDYALLSDMASVGLLFRDGDMRYWIQHSWICRESCDWNRINAPLTDWAAAGDLTIVNDVQIDPFLIVAWLKEQVDKYNILELVMDTARLPLVREALDSIGFTPIERRAKSSGNIWLARPLGIATVTPVIESWFRTGAIRWGELPLMRWATNNTKRVRMASQNASGNYRYDKIEPRSRKTDPFMALAHAAIRDELLDGGGTGELLDLGAFTW